MANIYKEWSTEDEIRFLNGLGNWANTEMSRYELLKNYGLSMKWRKNWGRINEVRIKAYIDKIWDQNEYSRNYAEKVKKSFSEQNKPSYTDI